MKILKVEKDKVQVELTKEELRLIASGLHEAGAIYDEITEDLYKALEE